MKYTKGELKFSTIYIALHDCNILINNSYKRTMKHGRVLKFVYISIVYLHAVKSSSFTYYDISRI